MIPREVEEALGDYSDAWRDGDDNIDAFRAALVAAIERAIEAAVQSDRRACFDKAGFTEEQIAEFKAMEEASHD